MGKSRIQHLDLNFVDEGEEGPDEHTGRSSGSGQVRMLSGRSHGRIGGMGFPTASALQLNTGSSGQLEDKTATGPPAPTLMQISSSPLHSSSFRGMQFQAKPSTYRQRLQAQFEPRKPVHQEHKSTESGDDSGDHSGNNRALNGGSGSGSTVAPHSMLSSTASFVINTEQTANGEHVKLTPRTAAGVAALFFGS